MLLTTRDVWSKLEQVDESLERALVSPQSLEVPELPGRDITYLPINLLSGKIGISSEEGQQKLLHDLANIELQAMELGLRTLIEFSWAPEEFRQQLVTIVKEEAKHLKMCLQGIEHLGGHWGKWPVHLGLWAAPHKKDSLLERVFIVHSYLEGSGLDAGDTILRRLSGFKSSVVQEVVKVIVDEEVGHVDFGSRWYKEFCQKQNVDEKIFFQRLLKKLMVRHPRKDKICTPLRKESGFDLDEIQWLEEARLSR